MDVGTIFRILQIDETKDKTAIKTAYRRLLPQRNPEDDPDGFKQLRQAYEEALRYADQPQEGEEPEKERDTSPVGLWLEEAEAIYRSWKRRLDPAQWQTLLKNDICQALDLAEEVQEKFLVFLMNHFRFPQEIWRLFDKEFHIVEQRRALTERFPQDYIHYICFEIESGGFFDFSLFEGPDDGEYDLYVNLYLQTKRLMDECAAAGPWEEEPTRRLGQQLDQLLGQMEAMDVYHPYGDVERLRLAMKADRKEEVRERLELLSWGAGAENIYVMLQCGSAREYLKEWDQAAQIYRELLEKQADNYPAGVGMLHCEMEAGSWVNAKERLMDLLDVSKNDPYLLEAMHQCNAHLIPEIRARLEADPDNWKERIELAWCLFQEEKSEECLALLHEKEVTPQMRIEYCNIASRTYLMRKEYELSLPLLEEWQQLMMELPDSEEPEIKKKKRRLGYSHYAIAFCLQEMENGEGAEEALPYYEEAIALEKDEDMLQSYLMGKAHMLCTILKRYEASADVCDQLLERNEQYMPAYVCRQECSYRLHRAQAVIDDYHRAVSIYPLYLPPYLMAAKVFYFYRQYQNAIEVIRKAREHELTGMELDYLEARTLRYLAEHAEDLDRPKELLRQVIRCLQEEEKQKEEGTYREPEPLSGADPVEESEVWKELAFCYMDEKAWDEALQIIRQAMQRFPDDDGLVYAEAGTLKGQEKYKEAEILYRQLLAGQPENTVIMTQLLDCMDGAGHRDGMEELCHRVLAIDEENTRAMYRLMHIYQDRMNEKRELSWFGKAISLADKLVKLRPSAYYHIERGLLLSDIYMLKEAIEDYEKAAELEPDNLYARNNAGVNFQHLGQYEEAEAYLKRAVELLEGEDKSILPWKNLAVLYLIQGRFDEAWRCVAENEKLFPDRASFYMDRAEILEKQGRFYEAIDEYQRFLDKKDPRSKRALVNIANVYAMKGDNRTALKCFKKLLKDFPGDHWIENQFIDFMLEEQVELRTAYTMLKKRLTDPAKDGKANFYDLVQMVEVCYYLKRKREREEYYARALSALEKCGPGKGEDYIGLAPAAPSYLYHLGLLHVFGGDLEKAEQMFTRMQKSLRCEFCHYGGCYEAMRGMALVRLHQGRFDEAEAYFKKALAINPYCGVSRSYLKNRRKW